MINTARIVQNDYGYSLQFSLQNSDGSAYDLTPVATVKMQAQHVTDTSLNVNGVMAVSGSPALGIVTYTVAQDDFITAGTYNAQIQLTLTLGGTVTFNNLQILVDPELPVTP